MKRCLGAVLIVVMLLSGCLPGEAAHMAAAAKGVRFSAVTGGYHIDFRSTSGALTIVPPHSRARLVIRELPGGKRLDLLYSVTAVRRAGKTYLLTGTAPWASFRFTLQLPSSAGLIHMMLQVTPRKSAPSPGRFTGDVALLGAPASDLTAYASGPPVAGSSVMLSSKALNSTALYLSNFTSLGRYFDRSSSGVTQGNFTYPNAGGKGSLVGAPGDGSFGYPVTAQDVASLPTRKPTLVLDSYLYLVPGVPPDEGSMAESYLRMLGTIYDNLARPNIPAVDWNALAAREANDLTAAANSVTLDGKRYLRSYVSDTRSAPELITQAGVLAGVKAYEARYHVTLALDAQLESTLSTFYDPQFHTVMNGPGHDPAARGESWYFVTNMISLLQLAQFGSQPARQLLLDSTDAVMALAHVNGYEFPQDFAYSDWNGKGTGVQSDVAGGYAYLMLGLYDLTKQQRYLDEAKAAIVHVEGRGLALSYETHMSAYAAAAAQSLYASTGDARYRRDAVLSLANLFHATRLWDCTYGNCRRGAGYHTYFGLNPLPWSDYVAMLEQYQAWLGLRDYMTHAAAEPASIKDLVQGFLTYTPLTMQYALPPRLPAGVATAAAGEYPFVPHNNLAWYIPLEDLREGEQNSGLIGQEIYGAGGPFMFAAYAASSSSATRLSGR